MTPLSLRVLIVEDSETDAKLIVRELRRAGHQVEFERVDGEEDLRAALGRAAWDVVISDWSLPRFSAQGALQVVREARLDLPFIIVSGTIGEESAVDAMRSGAHDYVLKHRMSRLAPAVERELRDHRERVARRKAEARFARLAESGIIGICVADVHGAVTEANDAYLELLGYTRADIAAGKLRWDVVTPPEYAAVNEVAAQDLLAKGVVRPWETAALRTDGTRVPILVGVAALEAPDCIAFVADLTRTNRAEQETRLFHDIALSVSEAKDTRTALGLVLLGLCRAADCAFGAAWIPAEDGGVLVPGATWSFDEDRDLAALMTEGWTFGPDDGLIGRVWRTRSPAWIGDVSQEPAFRRRAAAEQAGLRSGLIVPVIAKGEAIAVLECYATTPRGIELRVVELAVRLAAQVSSVIQRKRAEDELRQSEAKLLQSQKMEAVGLLAGGIAHDFNNLLAVILASSNFLLEDLETGDPRREDAVNIELAAERAASLTRQLLAFSRKQVLEPRPLDVNAVVFGLEKMLRRVIGEDIELQTVAAPSVGTVVADASQVEQLVMNLVVNARDAMPSGGKLRIETASLDLEAETATDVGSMPPGRYVRLSVQDTGCGMDAETQKRIFEPFFTTKGTGKGTGLGLSTCYGIVRQSGGFIAVRSALGEGTTFDIFLPRVDAAPNTMHSRAPGMVKSGTETVLLVEDDAAVRGIARKILQANGYQVLAAEDHVQAVAFARTHEGEVHLLLTDVVMPKVSGTELAVRIREIRPAIRVMFMSGYMDHSLLESGEIDPTRNLLRKPFTPESFASKVRELLDGNA